MARPGCPRHPHARVWLDGTYGSGGRRRQRFKCVSDEGRHSFTEPLPRRRTEHGECAECERAVASFEGPAAPRRCYYAAREIAATLARLGEGMSYRRAGRDVRVRAGRLTPSRRTGVVRPSIDSSVVEDWVEVFTPVVSEPFQVTEWPPLVELDDQPFYIRSRQPWGKKVCAFRVFGAIGFDPNRNRRVCRLEAFPDKHPPRWQQFLLALEGRPVTIVCDNESGMLAGIRRAWPHSPNEPAPIIVLSHWHLGAALRKLFHRYTVAGGPLSQALETAFGSASNWATFVQLARQTPFPQLHRWLDQLDDCWWLDGRVPRHERIAWQLALPWRDLPKSTAAIEQTLKNVAAAFEHRQFALRNRERTNLLLELIRLQEDGRANEAAYTRLIRAHLLANGGLGDRRGVIVEPRGTNSLWR